MPIQFSKYGLIIVLLLSPYFVKAEIDTTKNKLFLEIKIESILGYSSKISRLNYNHNIAKGVGINLGYTIRQNQRIKLGISLHQLYYKYSIERKVGLAPSGPPTQVVEFKEQIWMNTLSIGAIYSRDFASRFSIDVEAFLFFKIFNETRKREGTFFPSDLDEGLIVFGISHATKENFLGLYSRINYKITSDTSLGALLGIRTENISTPRFVDDSLYKLLFGISLTYRI